jgi:hypothetical protein
VARVVVVLSSGRTGSQFLARYFDANFSEVVATHEAPPSALLRVLSNAAASGALDRAQMLRWLSRLRARRVARLRPETAIYLESNGFLYGFTEVLSELWPDVAVVHVVRDPRDQIRSALAHGNDRGLKRLAAAVVPWWHPTPGATPGLEPPDPASGLVGRFATSWRVINQKIEDARPHCPDFLRLRFEELVDADASGLRALCAHLGLDFREGGSVAPDQRFNASTRVALPDWHDWSPVACRAVETACGPLMRSYGYGLEPEWQARLEPTPRSDGGSAG